ncbi:MAG: DUF4282 domain-containing protein [Solirubrobacterales bacterium]
MESSVQPTPPQQPPAQTQSPGGFFEALMDTRFDHLITLSLIRFLYVVAIIILALGTLAVIIGGFAESAGTGIVLLILAPIGALIYLIITRLWLELIVVAFKIREAAEEVAVNTRRPGV